MNKDSKIIGTVLAGGAGTGTGESRALVIWGVNLPSTVGVKYTRAQLAIVNLPFYERGVIVGLVLSDAWLRFSNSRSKNTHLGFRESLAHSQYV